VPGRGGPSWTTAAATSHADSFLNIIIIIMHARELPWNPPERPKLGGGAAADTLQVKRLLTLQSALPD